VQQVASKARMLRDKCQQEIKDSDVRFEDLSLLKYNAL
jgi:hypothetical protein